MSTRYKHFDTVPSAVLAKRLDELSDAVGKTGEERDRELTRRIPAELDRDADLVLSQAAKRLRDLEGERDALARELEAERYHRQAIERSEQALAAHVDSLFEAFNRIAIEGDGGMYSPRELEDELCAIFSDGPGTSLAQRDEEQCRKGFWWGFERARCHPDQYNIAAEWGEVRQLRRQAEGGDQ